MRRHGQNTEHSHPDCEASRMDELERLTQRVDPECRHRGSTATEVSGSYQGQ